MKCQMCGKSEVNFHYTSNINGNVTETNLCSDCADSAGYNFGSMFGLADFGSFGRQNGLSGFRPGRGLMGFAPQRQAGYIPMFGLGHPIQVTIKPLSASQLHQDGCSCGCGQADETHECRTESCECEAPGHATSATVSAVGVDDVMMRRRKLYKEMRMAADNDDFEKAAKLRDEIKAMEQ